MAQSKQLESTLKQIKSMDEVTLKARELYNEAKFGNFSYGTKRDKYDALLFEFLNLIKENKTVYDIGCGSGYWIDTCLRLGIKKEQITGVDLAPSNIENLKKKGIRAICDNGLSLSLEDNVSDFTISGGVIHHTSDPFKAFSELVRITKPGGYIFINIYQKWHPYFYIIHKLTFPIRWFYWHINKKIFDLIYPLTKIIFQPLSLLILGEFIDDRTGKMLFMDQVLTPKIHLLSKANLINYAKKCNCNIEKFQYNRFHVMLAAIMKVNK